MQINQSFTIASSKCVAFINISWKETTNYALVGKKSVQNTHWSVNRVVSICANKPKGIEFKLWISHLRRKKKRHTWQMQQTVNATKCVDLARSGDLIGICPNSGYSISQYWEYLLGFTIRIPQHTLALWWQMMCHYSQHKIIWARRILNLICSRSHEWWWIQRRFNKFCWIADASTPCEGY